MADAKADQEQEKARAAGGARPHALAIQAVLEARFGEAVCLVDAVDPYTVIKPVERFLEIMHALREDPALDFDFLRMVTGVDYPERQKIASVYHLFSYTHGIGHVLKFFCDRDAPVVPSVEAIWPTANWFEREAFDLTGIKYSDHSDLRRILLPDDWTGHPLRKDYVESESYHGIGTTRSSPLDAYKAMDELRRLRREAIGEAAPPMLVSPIKPPPDFVSPKRVVSNEEDE